MKIRFEYFLAFIVILCSFGFGYCWGNKLFPESGFIYIFFRLLTGLLFAVISYILILLINKTER